MKEIGSEFWDVPLVSQSNSVELFPQNTRFFLSGRSALSHIIEEIKTHHCLRNVLLPSYCCHTMIEPFLSRGITVRFYEVYLDENGQFVQKIPVKHSFDAILLVSYFGYAASNMCLTRPDGVVIYDATHSIFSPVGVNADYVYGSLRKWAGFWTGGFAWSCKEPFQMEPPKEYDENYVSIRKTAMAEKARFLSGWSDSNKDRYLQMFSQAEEMLNCSANLRAAPEDKERLKRLDIGQIQTCRKQNAEVILSFVQPYAVFPTLLAEDCPLFVPVAFPKKIRDALRQHLISKDIYCPIHWPVSVLHQLTKRAKQLYEMELSLVCDQRYDTSDMVRMGELIVEFLRLEGM